MKYHFTPEMDARIRETYRKNDGKRLDRKVPYVRELAASMGLPRWRVTRRAREIGAYEPRIKELPWSEAELDVLERNAHLHPERIRLKLKAAGFIRSTTGIILKRKRMNFLQSKDGYSAQQTAEAFGIDVHTVSRWIKGGLLRAQKRGTERTEKQGGDIYFIRDKWVRDFILDNVGLIDIRKVDKFWFVDVLAGRFLSSP